MARHLSFLFLFFLSNCSSQHHRHLNFSEWERSSDCCQTFGERIAISSGGTFSSRAGKEIFEAGGNIVDVGVATAFALAVERPHSLGLGGGGFLLLSLQGSSEKPSFVDFRETAPERASPRMYLDKSGTVLFEKSRKGILSVATPGFVPGLYEIHKKWGKLPWKQVLEPAIRIAKNGFPVYLSLARAFEEEKEELIKEPYLKQVFYPNNQSPQLKEILKQEDLAKTLERVSKNPEREFRDGFTAKAIDKFSKSRSGILSQRDLKEYRSRFRQPIKIYFDGKEVLLAPPPSAGGVIIGEILQMLRSDSLLQMQETQYLHLITEALKRAYSDRSHFIGDPDFSKIPTAQLLDEGYAARLRKSISMEKSSPSIDVKPGQHLEHREKHTTHVSVLDSQGNGLAMTLTINDHFGSRLAVPGTGIFLNDEMDDFSSKPGEPNLFGLVGSETNQILPRKRPASSMSPTLVLEKGKVILSLGAAGGSKITSSVLQVLLQILSRQSPDLRTALFHPRIHHQWLPDLLNYEDGFSEQALAMLKSKGHELVKIKRTAIVQSVYRTPRGILEAVFDPRDEGGVEGK